jgi:hypothetical protein
MSTRTCISRILFCQRMQLAMLQLYRLASEILTEKVLDICVLCSVHTLNRENGRRQRSGKRTELLLSSAATHGTHGLCSIIRNQSWSVTLRSSQATSFSPPWWCHDHCVCCTLVTSSSSSSDLGRSHEKVTSSSEIKMTDNNSNGAANTSGGEVHIQIPAGQFSTPNPWTITLMVVLSGPIELPCVSLAFL